MQKRIEDKTRTTHFRSDRFFTVENKWYFNTREESNLGPFATKAEAKRNLDMHIAFCDNVPTLNDQYRLVS